jgi:Bax protein
MTWTDALSRIPPRWRPWTLAGSLLLVLVLVGLWLTREPDFGRLPDFAALDDVDSMKAAFHDYLAPIVAYHNANIRADRARLDTIAEQVESGASLSGGDRRWLRRLAQRYELTTDGEDEVSALIPVLRRRVDIIPIELALAQAAKESGWGRSRFAVEANNLFGQWCYTPGCGVVPANRPAGASHEVETFGSVSEAIRRYMNNLNTHERYLELRMQRQQLRREDRPVTGMSLAGALVFYSERREAYVEELRGMIRQFQRMRQAGAGA